MPNYLIDIHDASEIVPAVFETARVAYEPSFIFLNHLEGHNIIRGPSEELNYGAGVPVFRRPDGGGTWYHHDTKCAMYVVPEPICGCSWTKELQKTLEEILPGEYQIGREGTITQIGSQQDIYRIIQGMPKQVMGTSWYGTSNGNDERIKLFRSCWYEENPTDAIAYMLKHDGIDVEEFRSKVGYLPKSLFEHMLERFNPTRTNAADFISEESWTKAYQIQKREGTRPIVPCVLSGFPER